MPRQQILFLETLMNQSFSNNPVIASALKLRVRTSGPISGSTGYVRLPYGERACEALTCEALGSMALNQFHKNTVSSKDFSSDNKSDARLIT